MISLPHVMAQCDQMVAGADGPERCRASAVITLPTWDSSRENATRLFLTLNREWAIGGSSGKFFCPQCANRARSGMLSAGAAVAVPVASAVTGSPRALRDARTDRGGELSMERLDGIDGEGGA